MQGRTFLTIEKQVGEKWEIVATDADWETKFLWERRHMAKSDAIIQWDIPYDAQPGTYRIRHFGHYKYVFGGIFPYEGVSDTFEVL